MGRSRRDEPAHGEAGRSRTRSPQHTGATRRGRRMREKAAVAPLGRPDEGTRSAPMGAPIGVRWGSASPGACRCLPSHSVRCVPGRGHGEIGLTDWPREVPGSGIVIRDVAGDLYHAKEPRRWHRQLLEELERILGPVRTSTGSTTGSWSCSRGRPARYGSPDRVAAPLQEEGYTAVHERDGIYASTRPGPACPGPWRRGGRGCPAPRSVQLSRGWDHRPRRRRPQGEFGSSTWSRQEGCPGERW